MKKILFLIVLVTFTFCGRNQSRSYLDSTNLRKLINKVNTLTPANLEEGLTDDTVLVWHNGAVYYKVNNMESYPIYYVDQTDGNNSSDGLSPATAWKTVSKVSATNYAPGTAIKFKRGEEWRESLLVTSSGSPDNYITYGAYGTGAPPKILGSVDVTTWTLSHGNVWYSYDAAYIDLHGFTYDGNIYFKETDGDITWGRIHKDTWAELAVEYDWALTLDTLYIYSPTDPNTRYTGVEMSQRTIVANLNDKNYLAFDGLEIAYGAFAGISEQWPATNLTGLTIKNCEVHHIGVKEIGYGLEVWHSDMVIRNDSIHDCGRRLVSMNIYSGDAQLHSVIIEDNTFYSAYHTSGVDMSSLDVGTIDSIIIRRNYFYENLSETLDGVESFASGFIYAEKEGTGDLTNIYIYNNIFKNGTSRDIALGGTNGVASSFIYSNTFYGKNANIEANQEFILIKAGTNSNIRNNVFYYDRAEASFACIGTEAAAGTVVMDYNLYYNTTTTRLLIWEGTAYTMAQWAAYKAASGQDSHSPTPADPLFTSINDYHLLTGSSAINAGITGAGIPITDYYRNPRVGATDIGAIEKQ